MRTLFCDYYFLQVLNHTMNVDGEKAWITAGLQYSNAETLWVGQNAIVFNESAITVHLTRVVVVLSLG